MKVDRREAEAWWRSPVASMILVVSGLAVIFIEVYRGPDADALGYSAGLALVGLGITGRLQAWALAGGDESKKADVLRDDLRAEERDDAP